MKTYSSFASNNESHQHSLNTLNLLYRYDDFMESVGRVIDLGCGKSARDLEWWATRTTNDELRIPLEIDCVGADIVPSIDLDLKNVAYQRKDIELLDSASKKYDVLWCHDVFQYMLNPYQTLSNWRNLANKDAMLILVLPQTVNIEFHTQAFDLPLGHFYNHTITTLLYMLSVTGWDCNGGFFKKDPGDPWLHAIVYNTDQPVKNPKDTHWYDLAETNLLPESACKSIDKHGTLRQQDLLLPWLDKSNHWFAQQ